MGQNRGEERQGLGEQGQRHRRPRRQSADVPSVAVVGRVGLQDILRISLLASLRENFREISRSVRKFS